MGRDRFESMEIMQLLGSELKVKEDDQVSVPDDQNVSETAQVNEKKS